MKEIKCPVCGSQRFYLKETPEAYDAFEFEIKDQEPVFEDEAKELTAATKVYCCRCTWQGPWQTLTA